MVTDKKISNRLRNFLLMFIYVYVNQKLKIFMAKVVILIDNLNIVFI